LQKEGKLGEAADLRHGSKGKKAESELGGNGVREAMVVGVEHNARGAKA